MDYITIILEIIILAALLSFFVLVLQNKFDNTLVRQTLNENIDVLLNSRTYTEKTQKKIKFILIIRFLFFTAGLISLARANLAPFFKWLILLILIILRIMGNSFIEKWLEKDYRDSFEGKEKQ